MPNEDHYRSLKAHMNGLRVHDHVCMAYDDHEQQVTAIAQFVKAGLELGERCFYVSDKANSDFVLHVLKDTGLDVEALIEKGALAVMTPEEVYLHNGTFDADAVISYGRLSIADTLQKGFKALRCACDMSWVKTYKIPPKALLDYEAKVSCLFEEHLVSICQYSTHIFDEQTIDSLLQNHPVSIHGGEITHNPMFAPPTHHVSMAHEQTA
jgi:MEDS: MEthanogen/methylotroph, DcmR Sensory domain